MSRPVISTADLDGLRMAFGDRLLRGAAAARFVRDASRALPAGEPLGVVVPRTTAEVSAALAWANSHRVPVSVRGAGTGLSGGAVAFAAGLVVSTHALRSTLEIDVPNRVAVADAGFLTKEIDDLALEHGLTYGPDPASHAVSTIGGNIATNAGGLRCVRYGVTSDNVAGLEVVLADGSVVTAGGRNRKDVSGYNLTHLFVGSEGTLGIVTSAILRLRPVPLGERRFFTAAFGSAADAGRAVSRIMSGPVTPSALEYLDRRSLAHLPRHLDRDSAPDAAALLAGEVHAPNAEELVQILRACATAEGAVSFGLDETSGLLDARRQVGDALSAAGLWYSCDAAVPPGALGPMLSSIEALEAESGIPISTVAHAGDGNLHATIDRADVTEAEASNVLGRLTSAALALGGTITGEHGIGSLRHGWLERRFDPATLAAMRAVKSALDPHGILSPGRGV